MPHINLPAGLPGILGLFKYRPDTGKSLNQLAELLRGVALIPGRTRTDCFLCILPE